MPLPVAGLPVRLTPGRAVAALPLTYPTDLVPQRRLWESVRLAARFPGAVESAEGWTRVLVAGARAGGASLVLRDADWVVLRTALDLELRDPAAPQDVPVEHVVARHLGRLDGLDGLDGTPGEERWGRLALEVVSVLVPGRYADSLSLRWTASWGRAGFGAGSEGWASGWGDRQTLSDLAQRRVVVQGRTYRVRALPDWEREQTAHDLGLPPARLMAWPVTPLPVLVELFDDQVPDPGPTRSVPGEPGVRGDQGDRGAQRPSGPQDVRPQDVRPQDAGPRPGSGPQDGR